MILGFLMVSPIPYHSFKGMRCGQSYSSTVIPVMVSIVLILEPGLNFFLVGLAYVISGPAGYFWRRRTGRRGHGEWRAALDLFDIGEPRGPQPELVETDPG